MNNGGPAFPIIEPNDCNSVTEGMSLRDWFAGQALVGELACQSETLGFYGAGEEAVQFCAKRCYELADAMLAERGK